MYCNVNFNVFFKLIKVHSLLRELYIYVANVARKQPQEKVWALRIMKEVEKCGLLHKEGHCNWITVQVK